MHEAQALAEWSAALTYEDLPAPVREAALHHLLDTLGAGLVGSRSAAAQAAVRGVAVTYGAGEAIVWGTAERLAPAGAALVNGVAAHAFEVDDSGGCDHSGAVVVPALLAALPLAAGAVSGRRLLTAVVVGYDVGRRAQDALGGYDAVNDRGWHSTGLCGGLAAAAAVSHLLALPVAETVSALGLAGSYAGGTWAFMADGAMSKRYHVGRAAEAGVSASALARTGFTGPAELFGAPWGGYLGIYGGETADAGVLTDGLGDEWWILRASYKPYATCRSTHAAADALIDLIAAGLDPNAVTGIDLHCNALTAGMCGGRDLTPLTQAQLGLPLTLASVLRRGDAALDDILACCAEPAETLAVIEKIRVIEDPAQEGIEEPRVIVRTADHVADVQAGFPRGGPDRPMTSGEIRTKFRGLAAQRLGDDAVAALEPAVLGLAAAKDVREVPSLLVTADSPALLG